MRLLKRLCQEALFMLPTSLQDDVQQLRTLRCDEAARTTLALQWRVYYKGTLQLCIALCERAETFLQPGLTSERDASSEPHEPQR